MAGGSSHQRKVVKKVIKKALEEGLQAHLPVAAPKSSDEERPTVWQKIGHFWGSTPIWGGLALLIGVVASQLSLKLLFVAVWGVFVFEFMRAGFIRTKKILGVFLVAVIFGICFLGLWKIYPKPKESPTLDQQLNAFAAKFPGLSNHLNPSIPTKIVETKIISTQPTLQISVTDKKVLILDNTSGDSDLMDFQINGLGYCLEPNPSLGRAVIKDRLTLGGDLEDAR